MPVKTALEHATFFQTFLDHHPAVAAAVSGGADSMALLHALAGLCADRGIDLHVLSVDHGLRAEAAAEAQQVKDYCRALDPAIKHTTLRWAGDKPEAALQEEARKARYALMADYCRENGISGLCLAHHRDDQAETVLMRLAAGSGLNGLAGMRAESLYSEEVTLLRPLLGVTKEDILTYCKAHNMPYINDPSNENEAFARVRLRKSMGVLAEEGLTSKRLSVTAQRLARAADALDYYCDLIWHSSALKNKTNQIVFNKNTFVDAPAEIAVRLIVRLIETLGPSKDYLPRMEKIENLTAALRAQEAVKPRTLGGVIFTRDDKAGEIIAKPE